MIILVFFSLVNLRTRFDETLGRISDSKNFGRGFVDLSSNPNSNPRPDIKILGRKFKSSAESFRFATGYLNLKYHTGCSNQPRNTFPMADILLRKQLLQNHLIINLAMTKSKRNTLLRQFKSCIDYNLNSAKVNVIDPIKDNLTLPLSV